MVPPSAIPNDGCTLSDPSPWYSGFLAKREVRKEMVLELATKRTDSESQNPMMNFGYQINVVV